MTQRKPKPDPDYYTAQLDAVWHTVAETLNVELDIISIKSRKQMYSKPRQLFFYFARLHTSASYFEIGRYAGGRDHSTIIHGCKAVENEMHYKSFRNLVQTIERNLTGRVPAHEDPEIKAKLFPPYLGFIAGG